MFDRKIIKKKKNRHHTTRKRLVDTLLESKYEEEKFWMTVSISCYNKVRRAKVIYRVIQNFCDKLCGLIELTIRNIFWRVVLKRTMVLCYDFIFILQVGNKYRRCSKCVSCTWLHSLHRRAITCRTLANMLELCLIWSNAVNIRSTSSCLVSTELMYTTLFTCLQGKKILRC